MQSENINTPKIKGQDNNNNKLNNELKYGKITDILNYPAVSNESYQKLELELNCEEYRNELNYLKEKNIMLEKRVKELQTKCSILNHKIQNNDEVTMFLHQRIEKLDKLYKALDIRLLNTENIEIIKNKKRIVFLETIQERIEKRFAFLSDHVTDIHNDLNSYRTKFIDLETSIKLYTLHTTVNKEVLNIVKNNASNTWDLILKVCSSEKMKTTI